LKQHPIDGAWLIFGGDNDLTFSTAAALRARGAVVGIVREGIRFETLGNLDYSLRPTVDADYATLFARVKRDGVPLRGILHLWNADLTGTHASQGVRPLRALTALARGLMREAPSDEVRIVVATSGAQSVNGEPVTAPARALVAGLVLSWPAEHAAVKVTAIDMGSATSDACAEQSARALVEEAAADDIEPFVACRAGARWVRRYTETSLPVAGKGSLPLKERGVYLVTGGTGGIGATLAEWLARQVSARVLLTARSPVQSRERLEAIEEAGGEVLVMSADVADEAAMRHAVDHARDHWGPIDGVIHAAGVPGGSAIAFAEGETDAVLRAKVDGTRVLARIFETVPLDFFVAFSSISAVAGSPGTCAYAAGCAYVDAFALSSDRPASWRLVQSIAWDAWRDVGMAERVVVPERMRAARRAYVAAGIAPAEGAEAFGRALAAGLPQCVVSPYEIDRILAHRRRQDSGQGDTTSRRFEETMPAPTAPQREAGPSGVLSGETEQRLASIWADLLGVQPVGAADNFFELGGHSLMATRVLARVDDQFGVRLPLRAVFEAPTVRQLARLVDMEGGRRDSSLVGVNEREEFEL
jgi:NAD(P)-dependent dehydrogenase (short-subunit alcohol dehydrogenase family)/acyl carrier protein